MTNNKITLGVQSGSPEASDAMRPAFLQLRERLAADCTASYSSSINEFSIILRIDGSIWHFEGEGIQRLRINRKAAYLTADYIVPEARWNGIPLLEIKKYVAAAVIETVQAMNQHLVKLKIIVDGAKLIEDVDKAAAAFLEEARNSE
jgi:hypothetical protein